MWKGRADEFRSVGLVTEGVCMHYALIDVYVRVYVGVRLWRTRGSPRLVRHVVAEPFPIGASTCWLW